LTNPITPYIGIRLEGGLLPASLLERLAASSRDLKGGRPEDYHLPAGERIGDAASRKWLYLRGAYLAFRERIDKLPESDPATTETREQWLLVLLTELGFGRVPFSRSAVSVAGKSYPVSHLWEQVPIHLVGWHTHLDKRGTAYGRAPQSMLQEFLNVSDDHLWGILSNGKQLRLLRDSRLLASASYVEFDLEAIFDGELYSDFLLLFMLVHESRFGLLPRDDDTPPTQADCWLERWRVEADEVGTRALDHLRDGVQAALEELGTGFLEANTVLRSKLESGQLTTSDFRHELLRLVYQVIFLFVAEDRGALHHEKAAPEAIESYQLYFSASRLRRIARRRRGDRNPDLWRTLVRVLDALGADHGERSLGLPGLGGLFFRPGSLDVPPGSLDVPPGSLDFRTGSRDKLGDRAPDLLRDAELRNDRLLAAIRMLDEISDARGRPQRVDYQHLGAEELGSIYESLLELDPDTSTAAQTFRLTERPGNERKTTGSYYTPRVLVETLLDTTLNPLIDKAASHRDAAELLKLRVCDPACGSGAFLVGAARRIATRYAAMTSGDEEPTPRAVTAAMHDVVRQCVYGVDVNPLAVELAQVSLWLESLTPGKPLAFLDSHLKVGNSLLGTTPKLLGTDHRGGVVIPDAAFKTVEGDDPKIAASLRKQNEKERTDQGSLFDVPVGARAGDYRLAEQVRGLALRSVRSPADIRDQVRDFREVEHNPGLLHRRQVANAWCAAFVWRKHADAPEAITTEALRRLDAEIPLPSDVASELDLLTAQYQFFHWHLEFLDIFRDQDDQARDHNPDTGWQGGFDCVIGNPPWERVKLQEQEFFAARRPEIAKARNAAARKRLIELLAVSDEPTDRRLSDEFRAALRQADGWSHLLRETGRYPLTGHGDINTYAVFAETARTIVVPSGRSGLVLPTGIGTDATTAPFFGDLVQHARLASFLEFENEAFLLSRAVHHSFRFCLLSMTGRAEEVDQANFAFRVRYMADLPDRRFTMPPGDLLLVNPNTGTTPLFRTRRDAEITFCIYRDVPVLWRDDTDENPWGISFMAMFHMANDSRLFRTVEQLVDDGWRLDGNVFVKDGKRMLPLYEAKMIHHFDHRYGTYTGQTEAQANVGTLPRPSPDEKADPGYAIEPRYWVQEWSVKNEKRSKPGKPVYDEEGVTTRLESRHWNQGWLIGWRDIARSSDERTLIAGILPRAGVGHTFPLALPGSRAAWLCANLSAFVLDYVARQKIAGTHLTFGYVNQFPVLPPDHYGMPSSWAPDVSVGEWIESRVLELTYTDWEMESFARDLGDDGPPFVWDEKRRFIIRAELDAAFFHLYGVERDDVDYIMDTFPVVNRRDEYRTKRLILEIFEALADVTKTGVPYRSVLDPTPGNGARHPARARSEAR
jgi:Eco57I restriction-modification methylase